MQGAHSRRGGVESASPAHGHPPVPDVVLGREAVVPHSAAFGFPVVVPARGHGALRHRVCDTGYSRTSTVCATSPLERAEHRVTYLPVVGRFGLAGNRVSSRAKCGPHFKGSNAHTGPNAVACPSQY